ncbi:hypothetical protein PHMEG_00025435 [Phytophthora megakarya]|uniref:Uncharacterized protein n=1 Tax=Phytophthora megakarya TaxID=4795 RepID=A0A225VBN9_9STRA|nr:hypothetical protein PHMEG_00025435 [Phytophthora megakarya]
MPPVQVALQSSTETASRIEAAPRMETTPHDPRRHQFVIRPITKRTLSQHERSWVPTKEGWAKVMQFKKNRHLFDSTKSTAGWDQWLQATRGKTVLLLIYEYGLAIAKGQDLKEFTRVCIVPPETDHAGATAETSLQKIVSKLQHQWAQTFQGTTTVWKMWTNHLTRNWNRFTWKSAISQLPPDHVAGLLLAANSRMEKHISTSLRTAHLALDCVIASIAENNQLREDWKAHGQDWMLKLLPWLLAKPLLKRLLEMCCHSKT